MPSRRAYLAGVAGSLPVALAGCLQDVRDATAGGNADDPAPASAGDGSLGSQRPNATGPSSEGGADDPASDDATADPDWRPAETPPEHLAGLSGQTWPTESGSTTPRSFEWEYDGATYSLSIPIRDTLLEYYEARPRVNDRGVYVSDPYQQPDLEEIALQIDELASDDREAVELARAFVQQLPYTQDGVSAGIQQYTAYPLETLLAGGGDCEDTAILLAALYSHLGYETVLLAYFDQAHMALGVAGEDSLPGTYYEREGTRYYYVETTAPGWTIGEVPESLDPSTTEFQRIDDDPVPVFEWRTTAKSDGRLRVAVDVWNVGLAAAEDVTVIVRSEGRDGVAFDSASTDLAALASEAAETVAVDLAVPAERACRVHVQVAVDGVLRDETRSARREAE